MTPTPNEAANIEAVKLGLFGICAAYRSDHPVMVGHIERAISLIDHQSQRIAELEEAQRWIAVSERLPELIIRSSGLRES